MPKILVTAPHSSFLVPPELKNRFALSTEQIKDICDVGTLETAQLLKSNNVQILTADVSRLVVDLNRFPDDNRNIGVFREKTFRGNHIFIDGKGITEEEKKHYKEKYYNTWHSKLLDAISNEPLLLHIDLHNTDETRFCLSAYTPGQPLRMEDFTDIDISNRSNYKKLNEPIDSEGLTYPAEEMAFFMDTMKKHTGKFIKDFFNREPESVRITASNFMRGGPIIQIARNKAKWINGISRSLQLEIQRQFFVDKNNNVDQNKIQGLAACLNGILQDVIKNLA